MHADVAAVQRVPFVGVRTLTSNLEAPRGVALLANGAAVVTTGDRIVLVYPDGRVSALAGGERGQADGPVSTARFKDPAGVAIDRATGTIYVADSGNHCIRAIANGVVTTLAGNGRIGFENGRGAAATFKMPVGLAIDKAGVLYVADSGNSAIRRVTTAGDVTTLAGNGREGATDGPASAATFMWPEGVAVSDTAVYVADTKNSRVRVIAGGEVTSLAVSAGLREPGGIAVNDDGSVIIADTKGDTIRALDPATGQFATIAGSGDNGFLDGAPAAARFNAPVAVAAAGMVVVADAKNSALRIVDQQAGVTAIAPQRGPAAGGTRVTVHGTGFAAGATAVRFGSAVATDVVLISSRELLCTTPAGDGTVDVKVTTAAGEATLASAYRYQRPPVIRAFLPLAARAGATLVVTGENFGETAGENSVTIGGAAATVIASSPTSISAIVPQGASSGSVTVRTSAGTATSGDPFTLVRYVGLAVAPTEVALAPGATAQLSATAAFSDGSTDVVTAAARWTTNNAAVVQVESGLVRATGTGSAVVSASFEGRTASATMTVASGESLPPDPKTIATQLDPSIATPFAESIRFLYAHSTPVQRDVVAGTIEDRRAAVLRGRVLDRDLRPLPGVRVTVAHDSRFGYTLSRADGWFDLVVNGGGDVALNYAKDGHIPIHRTVRTNWNRYSVADDAVMTPLDSAVTTIAAGSQSMQVARGNVVQDEDGQRRATLLFSPGTTATLMLPDGTSRALGSMRVRATEYTVGPNGPKAMPAKLPVTSGYTYCVELSVDEALTAGADSVVFSQPVVTYVDNFLGMPVGEPVPVGYYDRRRAMWIPEPNGIVLKVLSIAGGTAQVDLDGNGTADSDAALSAIGITPAERAQLASLYVAGTTLWRFSVTHFSPHDANWGISAEAEEWGRGPFRRRIRRDRQPDDPCYYNGSVVGCENQTLGERIGVQGTPFTLAYDSARVPGRSSARTISVSLTDSELPPGLRGVELTIDVAGRRFTKDYPALPNLEETFTWDGRDPYGRTVGGVQDVAVYVGWSYPAIYRRPGATLGFADYSTGPAVAASRTPFTSAEEQHAQMRPWDARGAGLGGWTLDVHHALDPAGNLTLYGDGTTRDGGAAAGSINTIAGRSLTFGDGCASGNGLAGTLQSLRAPTGIAAAADGSAVFSDFSCSLIYRIDAQGRLFWIGGGGTSFDDPGDGGPARGASVRNPTGVAIAPDGTIYVSQPNFNRVRRIEPNGRIYRHAGNDERGFGGDGGPAAAAMLNRPGALAVGPDGSLYIADAYNGRVRRVTNDGRITTVAGNGTEDAAADGALATESGIRGFVTGVAVTPDGTLLYVSNLSGFVYAVSPDGRLRRLMNLCQDEPCEGRYGGRTLKIAPDGTIYAVNGLSNYFQLYRLTADGGMKLVANGPSGYSQHGATDNFFGGDGGPAIGAYYGAPSDFAVGPDHSLFIADTFNRRVRKVAPMLARPRQNELIMATRDASEVHAFDAEGRHTRTLDPLLGTALYTFGYDADGRLETVTDLDGNVTRIERTADGSAAIVAPGGQRTKLTFGGEGMLESVSNEADETFVMSYAPGGLLRTFRTPRGHSSTFTYDSLGRLRRDANAAGGWQELSIEDRGTGYTVTRQSAPSLTRTYETNWLDNGDRQKRTTDAANLVTTILSQRSGYTFSSSPDGTGGLSVESHDPRFGLQSPFLRANVLQFPGGGFMQTSEERSATLSSAADPLAVAQESRAVSIGSRRYTSTFTASSRTSVFRTPAGRTATTTFDSRGAVSRVSVPGLADLQYSYDARGRLRQVTQGARTFTFGYNERNELTSLTDPLSQVTDFGHDSAGRVTSQRLPGARTIGFTYDANGNLEKVTPPGRAAHRFSWSPTDLATSYTPPEGVPTSFTYQADRLKSILAPDATISLGYDNAGRISSVASEENAFTFAWNGTTGQLDGISAAHGASLTYTLDGLLPKSVTWSGPVTGTVAVRYDDELRIAGESVNGAEVTFGYDADRLLTAAGAMSLTRDPANGSLKGTTLGNVKDTWVYNSYGEPETYTASHGANELLRLAYVRDGAGRITKQTETVAGVTTVLDYTYDAAGRLETVTRNGALHATYAYDANGNRLTRSTVTATETGSYNGQDRLLSYGSATYTYTASGTLKSKTDAQGTTTYRYDAFGNLRGVTTADGTAIEYVVDAQNRRVGKKVNGVMVRRWLYSGQLRIVAELDGNGTLLSRFVYASRTNIPDYIIRGASTYRILSDHLGSPRLIVNTADGAVVQQLAFDEFGRAVADTNPGFQPFGFAGGLWDRDSDLVRFGARDYDPTGGRWTSKEPLLFAGGDTNFYVYAFGEPVNVIDPNGLYAGWDDLAFAAGGALVGVGGQALADAISGEFSGWGAYGRAAAGGALGGWATLYGGPVLGGAVGAGVTSYLNQRASGSPCGVDWSTVAFDAGLGALTGKLFGASNMSGGVSRGSAGHVYKTTRTALRNGTITNIRPGTGAKMFRGALEEHQMPLGTAIGVGGATAYSQFNSGDCGCP